ncbi:tRNA-specific adenosine deaminase 2-like [Argonauta hians]
MESENMEWMQRAIDLAEEAYDAGEVPVGCIFIYDNTEIATGRNMVTQTKNATQHAEMVAIEKVYSWCEAHGKNAADVFAAITVVVTVEPCIMCTAALRTLNIPLVIYGCKNDRFGGCGSVMDVACDVVPSLGNRLHCISGVMADKAISLLKEFYKGENLNAPEDKRKIKTDTKKDIKKEGM